MVTITITVAALVATSILGYLMYQYKNQAESYKVKFNTIKEFADKAGSQILKLEHTNKDLTNQIVLMRGKIELLETKKGAPAMTTPTAKVEESKLAEFTAAVVKPKPRRRYKNKNKVKDTNQI